MRLLIFADLHATDGNEVCFTDANTTLQHLRVAKFFEDLTAVYDKYECDGIIDLGDTTSDRSSIPVPTIEILGAGVHALKDSSWNIKLTGNHEQYLRSTDITNRRLFEHKFTVVDGCEIFDMEDKLAFFCSYPADQAELATWITENAKQYPNRKKVLFGHFQVVGSMLNSGEALTGIPLDTFSAFDLVLLGHVHKPQSLTSKVHYVGSPFQQSWGEADENKRLAILDTDTLEVTWVPMKGYPQYKIVTYEDFCDQATTESNDRWRVELKSHKETEQFFAHPLFNRAEPVYAYSVDSKAEEASEVKQDWSVEGVLSSWLAVSPPSAAGIDVSLEEMIEIGKGIAEDSL